MGLAAWKGSKVTCQEQALRGGRRGARVWVSRVANHVPCTQSCAEGRHVPGTPSGHVLAAPSRIPAPSRLGRRQVAPRGPQVLMAASLSGLGGGPGASRLWDLSRSFLMLLLLLLLPPPLHNLGEAVPSQGLFFRLLPQPPPPPPATRNLPTFGAGTGADPGTWLFVLAI